MIKVDIKDQLDEILASISKNANQNYYGLGHEVEGAYEIGTRIEKTKSEEGDRNQDGAKGTIFGVLDATKANHPRVKYMYAVVFDGKSKIDDALKIVMITDYKVKPIEDE